jgi:hypothetical protein
VLRFDSDKRYIPKAILPGLPITPLSYSAARSQLIGRVRMETPVLYFYSAKPQDLRVTVAFPHGIISEWYPNALVKPTVLEQAALTSAQNTNASITWQKLSVIPGAKENFARGSDASHYYAARATDAAPIFVNGTEEKFLFYRGVGDFPAPLNVTAMENGRILLKHLAGKPSVILFENRGGKLGYRIVDTSKNEALLDPPTLAGNFDSLRGELETVLVGQGLYAKEAKAMVETWRDSWFEEGTRVFYVVPPQMVDQILPLTIEPKPAKVARVFVGRVEVFTPTTLAAVENAVIAKDQKALQAYGRFLGPITERLLDRRNPAESGAFASLLTSTFQSYIKDLSKCAN